MKNLIFRRRKKIVVAMEKKKSNFCKNHVSPDLQNSKNDLEIDRNVLIIMCVFYRHI